MLMLLEDASANTESVLDLIPGIFLIVNESHEVLRANGAFCELIDSQPEHAFRFQLSSLFSAANWALFAASMGQIIQPDVDGNVIAFDVELTLAKEGEKARPFHWVLTRLDMRNTGEGRIVSVFGQDMSAMKYVVDQSIALQRALSDLGAVLENLRNTQNDLVRSEKLAALGSMVAGIAHELNTPIGNSLMMATHLVKTGKQMEESAKAGLRRSMLDEFIADSGAVGEVLVRNLNKAAELVSSFKQLAVAQTAEQRRSFHLWETVTEVVAMLGGALEQSHCTVSQAIPAGITLDSYPGALGQVLSILLNNAILHAFVGRDAGHIHIDVAPSDPRQEPRVAGEESVVLTISDDGKGIPVDVLPLIFDPFFTTNRGAGRSGLGLNIAHNIVSAVLGGRINVESTLGFGTRFTLVIALAAPRRE